MESPKEETEKEEVQKEDRRNIYGIFRQNVEANSSHPLIIYHGRHFSYHSVLSMVDSLAESMKTKLSLSKGDRVGIALPLSPQFFIAFLASQKIGAVAVPLDPEMTDYEFRNNLSIVEPRALFVLDTTEFNPGSEDGLDSLVTVRLQDFLPFESSVLYTARHLGATARMKHQGFKLFRLAELIYDPKGDAAEIDPEDDSSVALISPSRSGELQAMYFTHRNVISSVEAVSRNLSKSKGRFRIATTMPPFLPGPLQLSVILTLFMGGTVTTVLDRSKYYRLFFLCSLFDSDYILVSPYDVSRILESGLPNLAIKGLKGLLCNSYLLNQDSRRELEKKYGTRVIEYYGIPEMLGVTHFQSQDRSQEVSGSPGSTIQGVDALILEEKSHEPVQEGKIGELYIRGPGLSTQFNPPIDDADQYYVDGYLDSGDLAQIRDSVIFIMEERRREAIVSKGILVSAKEIEGVISEVEGVSEVAVVGIPNNRGEEDILAVVSTETEDSGLSGKIMKACRSKLSSYKVPKEIEFRKELPKTMEGSILKRQIIEDRTKPQ